MSKEPSALDKLVGLAIMYPAFVTFAAIDVAIAPIRFVNDRVKNEKGESITDILRDCFKTSNS